MKQQITKKAIEASFIKLLGEKPFDRITVRDIVEDCGLTRNAFYYYFDDIFGIVDEILEAEIKRAISEKVEKGKSWEEIFTAAARFAESNKKAVYHLFRSQRRDELSGYIHKALKTIIGCYVEQIGGEEDVDEKDILLIVSHYEYAVWGLIKEWLKSGMDYSLSDILGRDMLLFEHSLENALEKARELNK